MQVFLGHNENATIRTIIPTKIVLSFVAAHARKRSVLIFSEGWLYRLPWAWGKRWQRSPRRIGYAVDASPEVFGEWLQGNMFIRFWWFGGALLARPNLSPLGQKTILGSLNQYVAAVV